VVVSVGWLTTVGMWRLVRVALYTSGLRPSPFQLSSPFARFNTSGSSRLVYIPLGSPCLPTINTNSFHLHGRAVMEITRGVLCHVPSDEREREGQTVNIYGTNIAQNKYRKRPNKLRNRVMGHNPTPSPKRKQFACHAQPTWT